MRCTGFHPFYHKPPPVKGWLVGLDWPWGIGQILWPRILEWLPRDSIRSITWYRRGDGMRGGGSIPEQIHFRNGSNLTLKAASSGPQKFAGAPLDFVGVDEETPVDIVEECQARLVKMAGHFWVTLTPLRRERWVLDFERQPTTVTIRASMTQAAEAGLLDVVAVAEYLDGLPDRQRKVRDFGDFSSLEGLVWPAFDRDLHVLIPRANELQTQQGEFVCPWPLPSNWPRYGAIDFGFGVPTAITVGAMDIETLTHYVYLCPYAASIRASKWGDIIPEVLPPLHRPLISDHDRSEREELEAKGIATTAAKKDIDLGLDAVERWLQPRKGLRPRLQLVVHDKDAPRHPVIGRYDAHPLEWEMEAYRYPSKRGPESADPAKDLPLRKDNHACDALRYKVMDLDDGGKPPPMPGELQLDSLPESPFDDIGLLGPGEHRPVDDWYSVD